jgi:hypothetical protein
MGRPIKSKFFGNTNAGATRRSDDQIGGEGIASLTVGNSGSYQINNANSAPTVTVAAPEIPTGVRATVEITWEVDRITVANGLAGHGYVTGPATLTGLAGVTANVTAVGSGQGEIQAIVPVDRGEFTTVPTAASTYQALQVGHGDGNQQLNVFYRIKTIAITEPGSGYRSAPAVSFAGGTGTAATVTATLAATQTNALDFVAWIPGGESALVGDIINQVTTTAYRVRTADGIGKVKLVADTPGEGEMALIATDSWGSEYYVIRLYEHLARVVQKAGEGFQFASGSQVKWTFGEAVENNSVSVANK